MAGRLREELRARIAGCFPQRESREIGPALYANSEQLDLINQTMDGIRVWP